MEVRFEHSSYDVAESDDASTVDKRENEVTVKVTLSADPERTVTIPLSTANQGGASDSDYSGVPANVTFNSGETEKSFTFTATQDSVDDDGESVELTFGSPARRGVCRPSPQDRRLHHRRRRAECDGELRARPRTRGRGRHGDGDGHPDEDPERTVHIPITKVNQGTASDADYSGVPGQRHFASGETERSITFSTHDAATMGRA